MLYHWFVVAMIAMLLATLLAIAPPTPSAQRVDEALVRLAQQRPNSLVFVIIQRQRQRQTPIALIEQRVADYDGVVLEELPIIDGFRARIRAGAIPQLAQIDQVHWISLDAPTTACYAPLCGDPDSQPLLTGLLPAGALPPIAPSR
jgi:hypothetical protein